MIAETQVTFSDNVLTQLQNRSFYVVERTRTSSKCQKMKNARAKRVKIQFFIVKYANMWGFCCRRRRGCLSSLLTAWTTSMLNFWSTKNLLTINRSRTTFLIENLIVISSTLLRMQLSYSSYLVAESTHSQLSKTCDKIQRWEVENSPFVLR